MAGQSVSIRSYVKEREAEIMKRLRTGMDKAVLIVESQAKENIINHSSKTPWKSTGQLASNVVSVVSATNEQVIGEIGIRTGVKEASSQTTLAKIGKYLELGHIQHPGQFVSAIGRRLKASYVPAYPWLFPAVESSREKIKEALKGHTFEVE